MSSQPPEAETYDIDLSRDEQWIVHHALVSYADDQIDDGDTPSSWVLAALETVEFDEENTFTSYQARQLETVLSDYIEREGTPADDAAHGSAVIETLTDRLDLEECADLEAEQ
ncbi:DUF7853 family protein [Natronolimnobius baerhuensis]|uniref:Uncharacterized protein n=1 Tax=Natronolimnobius baerhuensis TaxID=253108 RepID=A0A202E9E4_9EURY|nr:hypothetical protein [Natronolimnobius baerhuensis]OVE84847.1 hypothetical protein B2G88_10760 [Natronolimnobius baerhuensis]